MAKQLIVRMTPPEVEAGVKRKYQARKNGTLVNDCDIGSEQLEVFALVVAGDELKVSIGKAELTITVKEGDTKDGGKDGIGYIVEQADVETLRPKMRKPKPTQLPAQPPPAKPTQMPAQTQSQQPQSGVVPDGSVTPHYDPRFGNIQSPPSDRAPQAGQVLVDGKPENLGPQQPAATQVIQPAGVPIPITNQPTINPMVSPPQPVVNPSRKPG